MSVGVIQNIMVETVKKMSTKVDFLLFFNLNKVETVKKMSTEVDQKRTGRTGSLKL